MLLPEKGYTRVIILTFYIVLIVLATFVFFKYIFVCALPFLCAYIIASASRKPVMYLCNKFKFTRFFSVLVVTLTILSFLLALIYLLFSGIITELSSLAKLLNEEKITGFFSGISASLLSIISDYFPTLALKLEPQISSISSFFDALTVKALDYILPTLASIAIKIFKLFPNILLFSGVTLLSLFYFGCDYEKINIFIQNQLSHKHQKFACELKSQMFSTVLSILRAYLILYFITFTELLTGFLIIDVPYATLLSIIISLVDILPIFGTGTVLVPGAIVLFLYGNTSTAVAILALYVIITVIRQIAEPKIIGASLGLHPLLTLISMYFGIKLFGILGLFVLPLIIIIIKNLNEKEIIHLYKNLKS